MSASHLQAIHDVCHIIRAIPLAVYIRNQKSTGATLALLRCTFCLAFPLVFPRKQKMSANFAQNLGFNHPVMCTVTYSPHGKRIAIIIPLYEMHQNTVRSRFLAEANTFLHSRRKGHWNILGESTTKYFASFMQLICIKMHPR